jgi:2-oxo-4-hydroxy-4-carboxy-5-ureidoimidazoline decarboxylase
MEKYAGIYEKTPWIAEAAFRAGPPATVEALHAAMKAAVEAAPRDRQLALVRAHPMLAVKAADMAEHSVSEQKGVGLDRCTPEEAAEFQRLNAAYAEKFGFPFIVAVKGLTRGDILARFRARLQNDADAEFRTALDEIHKITLFRLQAAGAP